MRSPRADAVRARQAVGERALPAGGRWRRRWCPAPESRAVVEQPLAERDRRGIAGHAIGRIALPRRRPRPVARGCAARSRCATAAGSGAAARPRGIAAASAGDARRSAQRSAAAGHSQAQRRGEPLGAGAGVDVEHQVPAARHVEQQALGAIGAGAARRDRRAVVHAVPVLGHARVDAHSPSAAPRRRAGRRRCRARSARRLTIGAGTVANAIVVARCSRRAAVAVRSVSPQRDGVRRDGERASGSSEAARPDAALTCAARGFQCAEQRLAVAPRDALGQRRRQVGEPRARPVRVLDDVVPALGREGVGADHEAVRELGEQRAPLGAAPCRRRPARCGTRGRTTGCGACAASSRTPSGAVEARVRPQDARVRVLPEQALDRVGVRVRVQHEPVLLRERDHAPRHRQVGIGAVEVELADRRVAAVAPAAPRGTRRPCRRAPRCRRRRACDTGRSDGTMRSGAAATSRCVPSSPELDTSARLQPGLAQDRDRVLRRQVVPRVVAVVDVRVEDRQRHDLRHGGGRQRGDEGERRHRLQQEARPTRS